jgi:cytosine/adenosine deaminase-related metal-dependent hydrolase
MAMNHGPRSLPPSARVNAHTHLYSGLAPFGLPVPSPLPGGFAGILERIWWRLDRALDEDSLRAAARLHAAEALLHGTTTLIDHHESPGLIDGSLDILANVCDELGVRAILCYGASERNGGRPEARAGLAECRRFILENDRPLVRGAIGLHASFTVSDDTVVEAGDLCRELDVPLHVHVAEATDDVEDAKERGYPGPFERLFQLDALPGRSILAHGVHLGEDQVRQADGLGLWLVQNPRSNENNGVGYPGTLWASSRVALGTDGYPSDMVAEFAELERLAGALDPEHSSPSVLLDRFTGGARLVKELFPGGDPADDEVVFSPDTSRVERAIVGGRPLVETERLVAADIEEIRARAREQAALLFRRMEDLP